MKKIFQKTKLLHYRCNNFSTNTKIDQYYKINVSSSLGDLLKKIDDRREEIKGLKEKMKNKDINLQSLINEKLRALWTYNSNAIEGNSLTLGDTIFFLQEGITVDGKPFKDFVEANNHAEAIDYLYDIVQKIRDVDTHFIKTMNAILLDRVGFIEARDEFQNRIKVKIHGGEYKTKINKVLLPDGTFHSYVEPYQVPAQMDDLVQWINTSKEHPIITASIAHYNMVRIHPFQDGNGRASRILMNLILIKEGHVPAIIYYKDRKKYLQSLRTADKGDLEPFATFVAESMISTQDVIIQDYVDNLN